MAAGTAAAIVPVKSITMKSKGDKFAYEAAQKEVPSVCAKLLSTLKGIQQGKIEDKQSWLFKVERPTQFGRPQSNGDAHTVGQLP